MSVQTKRPGSMVGVAGANIFRQHFRNLQRCVQVFALARHFVELYVAGGQLTSFVGLDAAVKLLGHVSNAASIFLVAPA